MDPYTQHAISYFHPHHEYDISEREFLDEQREWAVCYDPDHEHAQTVESHLIRRDRFQLNCGKFPKVHSPCTLLARNVLLPCQAMCQSNL